MSSFRGPSEPSGHLPFRHSRETRDTLQEGVFLAVTNPKDSHIWSRLGQATKLDRGGRCIGARPARDRAPGDA